MKLKEGEFRSHLRKMFFAIRALKHKNSFVREVVDNPCLRAFKDLGCSEKPDPAGDVPAHCRAAGLNDL